MPYNASSWENDLESLDFNNPYAIAAFKLKVLHSAMSSALQKAKEQHFQDMKQVAPGIWISKKYNNLSEALKSLPLPPLP